METKLCRICGKLGENNVHIFKTEGLKNKIETCLPIIVSQYCLLPDTICSECLENVENFYSFIKNCLQNIIVLEAQYDITESCLKTKRKHEKSSFADISVIKHDKNIQTDDDDCLFLSQCNSTKLDLSVLEKLDKALSNADSILKGRDTKLTSRIPKVESKIRLVNYENETDSNSDEEAEIKNILINEKVLMSSQSQAVIVTDPPNTSKCLRQFDSNLCTLKNYFDDAENNIINEIVQRKKRKAEEIGSEKTKIFKMDTNSKRKSKNPKKVQPLKIHVVNEDLIEKCFENSTQDIIQELNQNCVVNDFTMMKPNNYQEQTTIEKIAKTERNILSSIPQVCLLCDMQFPGPSSLTSHVYESHGIDMAKVVASCPVVEEKKKRIPNLVKITDLKNRNEQGQYYTKRVSLVPWDPANAPFDVTKQGVVEQPVLLHEDPPQLQPSFVCPLCPAVQTSRPELFSHLRAKHAKQTALMCSLCFHMSTTYMKLAAHLEICKKQYSVPSKYICKLCCYHDDNCKVVENHILVHDFIISCCKKQLRIFDPSDYVETNPIYEGSSTKPYTCSECDTGGFATFKEFSTHRRSCHQIFHCDLCNKFYGRNSHLWKHVNRLHKGHPSITCQLCYKTSASKYHLAQHFNKIHSAKTYQFHDKEDADNMENFMKKKFDGFDFQFVKQSFMRQELMEQDRKRNSSENSEDEEEDVDEKGEDCTKAIPPKEIDASSDLYTNIITNYTPPRNEGAYKCPKCFRGFHKKALLKKHKKNCRPRLQKDLLTRCKSCSRIFKDRQSLAKHLINYHSEYVCEICKQKVQSKCEIVSHIRFSHPNCHLFCHSCGNILRSKVDLAEHKKDHRNSFVCQFCGDMLPTKIKLKMHILSLHRKILSLSCGICLKLFETQHILRDHVQMVHKNHLSPLTSCTVCGKNYGSKWKTYDHLNKSHGRIFKACKMCLEVFDTEDDLRSHYDSMHANNLNNVNASIKITATPVNVENNPSKNSVKKEELSSDLEGNNEDQEAKNSSSEISNDTEMFQQLKSSDCEDCLANQNNYVALADLPVKEEKISLLEKRLLGSITQEVDKKLSKTHETTKSKNNVIKIEAKFVSYESPSNSNSKQPEEVTVTEINGTSSLTPFSNSSKRTVYVNSNDPSVCEICLKTWPAKKHLWQHYIRCHKRVAATVCGICLKTNETYEALQMHLIKTHPTLLHGQGFGSNFICRICGRYHNASSKLKLHMAIHENFDWSLLDNFYPKNNSDLFEKDQQIKDDEVDEEQEEEEDEEMEDDKTVINNGYNHEDYVKEEDDEEEVVNYESLIEQVEVDASLESDSDCEEANNKEDEEEEEGNSVTSSDNESVLSEENSLENKMLQNMLKEKEKLESSVVVKQEDEENEEDDEDDDQEKQQYVGGPFENLQKFYAESTKKLQKESLAKQEEEEETVEEVYSSSDDSDDTSDSVQTVSDDVKNDSSDSQYSNPVENDPKSDELDSAIRSISYEEMNCVNEVLDDEVCDIQTHTLNQREIQSAVDSIL